VSPGLASEPCAERPLAADDPLTRIPGIGPKTAALLAEAGAHRVLDLLLHLPRRYEDRSRLSALDGELEPGSWVLVRGRLRGLRTRRPRRRLTIVDGVVDDGRGELAVLWFNQPWLGRRPFGEREFYLFGQLRLGARQRLQLVNPELEEAEEGGERLVPVYPRLGPFGGRRLRRAIEACLPALDRCDDPIPPELRDRFDLPGLGPALHRLHAPEPEARSVAGEGAIGLEERLEPCRLRLAFDELLAMSCAVAARRGRRRQGAAPAVASAAAQRAMARQLLPFELTAAQQRVTAEIAADLGRSTPMGRLLQGDVGSGKTAVAALALAMALEAGLQAAVMVPTELLAEQHARTLERFLGPAGWPPCLLTASQPAAARRDARKGIADGSQRLVVGTHALFQEGLSYAALGLVVIDEQHRFGVVQRSALAAKGSAPHVLVMTATPIPRSLALTVYGDLELSVIDELPPGRRVVRTVVRPESARQKVLEFVAAEVAKGGRAYVVYPFIEAAEEIPAAALREHEALVRRHCPGVGVGVLHGRLSREQRDAVTAAFRAGAIQILLATTVVEVGVDVPEATVMVVESAQRFGLSQLHQLRGRVGRGERPAWCVLLADEDIGEAARTRLEILSRCHDGFRIAEEDLAMRGPGELTGVRQWGPAGFRFASLARDHALVEATRDLAAELAARGELGEQQARLARIHPAAGPGIGS
jgi:ATP-dependent DNA helicase RecG